MRVIYSKAALINNGTAFLFYPVLFNNMLIWVKYTCKHSAFSTNQKNECKMDNNTPIKSIQNVLMCPCGQTERANLERIRRTAFMKVFLFWLPLKRYKCYKCQQNKWIMQSN
jgi:hypothetical protein